MGTANSGRPGIRRHSTHGQPSVETTVRRDAGVGHGGAPAEGAGNCCGDSLRYVLNARPAASQALMQLAGSKAGGWCILNKTRESKRGTPVECFFYANCSNHRVHRPGRLLSH
jgi:hypothetical protein